MIGIPCSVLFDLDGTILDSLPGIEFSVRAAFSACNLSLSELSLRSLLGPPIRVILAAAGDISDTDTLDALEKAFRRSYDSEGWQMTACFPGAEFALHELKRQGHRLFVVSNKPRHISLRTLRRHGIADSFESVVTRDSRSPAYRDKHEMIQNILFSHQLVSDNCLMVGDTMEDAVAAASAGLRFISMAHGYGDWQKASSVPADCVLHDFSQLLNLMSRDAAT